MGGWEKHKNDRSEENRRRSRGEGGGEEKKKLRASRNASAVL